MSLSLAFQLLILINRHLFQRTKSLMKNLLWLQKKAPVTTSKIQRQMFLNLIRQEQIRKINKPSQLKKKHLKIIKRLCSCLFVKNKQMIVEITNQVANQTLQNQSLIQGMIYRTMRVIMTTRGQLNSIQILIFLAKLERQV